MIDKKLVVEWKEHPVTVEILAELAESKELALQSILHGDILNDPAELGRMTGIIHLIEQIENFTPVEE